MTNSPLAAVPIAVIAVAAYGCGDSARARIHEALDRVEETASQIHALLEEERDAFAIADSQAAIPECPTDWRRSRDISRRGSGHSPDYAAALDEAYDLFSACQVSVRELHGTRRQNERELGVYEPEAVIERTNRLRELLADTRTLNEDLSWYITERADSDMEVLDPVVSSYFTGANARYYLLRDVTLGGPRLEIDLDAVRQRIAERSRTVLAVNLPNLEAAIDRVGPFRSSDPFLDCCVIR